MVEQKRSSRTPGSVGAAVTALQSASGAYLLVRHVRARRRDARAGERS